MTPDPAEGGGAAGLGGIAGEKGLLERTGGGTTFAGNETGLKRLFGGGNSEPSDAVT